MKIKILQVIREEIQKYIAEKELEKESKREYVIETISKKWSSVELEEFNMNMTIVSGGWLGSYNEVSAKESIIRSCYDLFSEEEREELYSIAASSSIEKTLNR